MLIFYACIPQGAYVVLYTKLKWLSRDSLVILTTLCSVTPETQGGVGDTIPHLTYMSTLSGEKERKGKRSEGAARQFRHHGSADDHTLPHWFAVLVGGGEVG